MLYDYKFSLEKMGQLKNYKKDNDFNHTLLSIEDIEFSRYEVNCKVKYKKTVPLNMFEKYSVKLLEKANVIYMDMNISKIGELLHVDERLIKQNLENLEQIGMLNGINSDIITINTEENAEYLQYENKFQIENTNTSFELTQSEYQDIDLYVKQEFENNKENKENKFNSYDILNEVNSKKNVSLFNYSDNKFLILSDNGINNKNDTKFIDGNTFDSISNGENIEENILCHYQEFLPLLRDKLSINKDSIVVIGSKIIEDNSLDVLKFNKNLDAMYILSNMENEHKRVFNIDIEDFVWIGDDVFIKNDTFVVKSKHNGLKWKIKQKLKDFFINKIVEIDSNYDIEKFDELSEQIENIKEEVSKYKFQTKKEIDDEIKKINTDKNGLYGLKNMKPKMRANIRKKIDGYELNNNAKELTKYPEYIKNKDEIFDLKEKVQLLENQKKDIEKLEKDLNKLNHEKSELISKEKKQKITPFEIELKRIERLKI